MADIFLSYSSEDRQRIEPLVGHLEGAGYSVWWDREIKGGTLFSEKIEREVREASVVVVAWSPVSIKSRWVADEAELALETGNLLPISLDGVRSPMGFRQLQTIDFSEWTGGSEVPCVTALLDALNHHLKGGTETPSEGIALPASPHTRSDASIAVLPFVDMSPDHDQEYFTDGISEELLNLLSKIHELTVIARTSSFSFKGSDKPISEIGEILGVAHVLEGSVRKAGTRVRITAQLIETRKSSHLWSETYDRDLDDIFAIQDEISAAIVEELKGLIIGGQNIKAPRTERTSDIEAYEHYLLGQQLLNKRMRQDIERAREHFEKSLKGDPDYVPALVGLADAHLLLSNAPGCYGTTPLKKALEAAQPLLDRAFEQDEASAEVQGIMSLYHLLAGDTALALEHAQRAIALNPNYSRGYTLLASVYGELGDPDAPILSARRSAIERDPASLLALYGLALEYTRRLDSDGLEAQQRQMALVNPDAQFLTSSRTFEMTFKGEFKAALGLNLAPEMAFESRIITWEIRAIAFVLGYGESFEAIEPAAALLLYAFAGQLDDARRVGSIVAGTDGARENYKTVLALARWHCLEGKYEEALALLTPFDESDPDKWGRHFAFGYDYLGATLSLYLRGKLGKKVSARLYLDKLKDLHQILMNDPDGQYYNTDFIGAVIAAAEGDKDAALIALEQQVERTMYNSFPFFLKCPNFEDLADDPRYQALLLRVEAHHAKERAAAEAAGLLPIPEELMARLRAD